MIAMSQEVDEHMSLSRRAFVKNTSLLAFSVAVFGKVHWVNGAYVGNTPTTTDVLGPFYRPGAPLRMNLNPPDFAGTPLHLAGTVFKDNGKTPFKNCLIEIWQAQPNHEYDNLSDDFKYRGSGKTGRDGSYHFITTHPPAYPLTPDNSTYRPSHIHLRISGESDESDLITQVYFKGDQYLDKDDYSSAPSAIHRILEVTRNAKNEDLVRFDIIMSKEFSLEDAAFKKVIGVYDAGQELNAFYAPGQLQLYKSGNLLFIKCNGQIFEALRYTGNNTFDNEEDFKFKFELLQGGGAKLIASARMKGTWKTFECRKVLTY
jgi:catechol 1,2-dioxygenase